MLETATFIIGTDAAAAGTLSDDVGEVERSSSDSRAQSSRQALQSVTGCSVISAAGPVKRP